MDRIALAKRLESLSSVFASHTPYNRDLRAMSYVLNKMADDKFTSILSGEFSPDKLEACMCGAGPGVGPMTKIPVGGPVDEPEGLPGGEPKVIVIEKEEGVPMSAEANEKTAGMFWCKEASKAVVDNLLRDVVGMNKSQCCSTGAKLEAKQVPNGSHDGEKASTLKPDQTPDDAASIKTNMVEKSRGAVKKEAGSIKGPGVPDGTGPMKDSPECKMKKEEEKEASLEDIKKAKKEKEEKAMKKDVEKLKKEKKEKKASEEGEDEKAEQAAEKKEEKAKELLEEAEKDEKKAEEGDKDATTESSSSSFEGIELVASMEEVELNAAEADQLSKLFE